MTKQDGGPAFPSETRHPDGTQVFEGMSLRDYLAAHAPDMPPSWYVEGLEKIPDPVRAVIAWRWYYADAMLKERDQ